MIFDKRGVGMSKRMPGAATLEDRMDDIRAVMDAAGSRRAVIFGASESGPMSILFAATYPERTAALVVYGSNVCGGWHEDDPVAVARWPTRAAYEKHVEENVAEVQRRWGDPAMHVQGLAPSRAGDAGFASWITRMECLGASPNSAIALSRMNAEIDIRPVVSSVHVPTLILQREHDSTVPVERSRYLAAYLSGAKYVELPGGDHLPSVDGMDQPRLLHRHRPLGRLQRQCDPAPAIPGR
jgi:pimeloyl-ACP methyl ester carboxylesterase